jgi:hypothetical protein
MNPMRKDVLGFSMVLDFLFSEKKQMEKRMDGQIFDVTDYVWRMYILSVHPPAPKKRKAKHVSSSS